MNRYPDMGNVDLFAALATRLDVPVEDLTLATCAVGLIYQVLQAFCDPADEVVHAWRSFEAYPIAVTAAAATSVRVPVTATGEHDLEAMHAPTTERTKGEMVCPPQHQTGPDTHPPALAAFPYRVPPHAREVVDRAD